ncbi:MAG: hypothetical protein HYV32_05950 [Candidatus Kerfeldbacteria bacterium]|nr:hypothetical protein [Candidatus Kerfeldbacteria bacterium]
MQHIADMQNVDCIHIVKMGLSTSDNPMTADKWKSIFLPYLNKNGYSSINDETWQKKFIPKSLVSR